MKKLLFAALTIAPLLCAAQPSGTEVRARQLSADSYEMVITTVQTSDVAVAQQALMPFANKICGSKETQFGYYKFSSTERVTGQGSASPQTLTLTQQVKCGTATREQAQGAVSSSSQWQPSKDDQASIELLTYRYFQEKDAGNYQNAYLMFAESMKSAVALESWQVKAKQFNSKAGKVLKRQITKITWYNNPATSPTPGIFAAADYVSQFENIDIHCGFVAWRQEKNGQYQMVREEENFIDKATQSTMKESDLAKTKAQFGCR